MLLKYGLLALAYLLGSIPFSIILGKKFKDIDIRNHGSGNPGGTNSLRFLGKKVGIAVLILDGLKAGLIVLLIRYEVIDPELVLHPLYYGVAAAVGHVFSIYIKFRGGKAVAATVGMMIAYNIPYALIMFTVFMVALKIWKYVSIASVTSVGAGLLVGISVGLIGSNYRFLDGVYPSTWSMAICFTILFILVIFRHRKNFNNIRNNVEPKVSFI